MAPLWQVAAGATARASWYLRDGEGRAAGTNDATGPRGAEARAPRDAGRRDGPPRCGGPRPARRPRRRLERDVVVRRVAAAAERRARGLEVAVVDRDVGGARREAAAASAAGEAALVAAAEELHGVGHDLD